MKVSMKSKLDLDSLEIGQTRVVEKSGYVNVFISNYHKNNEKRFKTRTEGGQIVITRVS